MTYQHQQRIFYEKKIVNFPDFKNILKKFGKFLP